MKLTSLLVTLFMRKGGVEILNKLYLHESEILKYEMMPIKGLQPEEVVLPKQALAAKGGIYFSSVLLCMWDNIHGPSVLMVWTGPRAVEGASHEGRPVAESHLPSSPSSPSPPPPYSDATLLTVANYTLNDEAGRMEDIEGIESKFYRLEKYNIIASAFVFTAEVLRGKSEVFSFIFVLPLSAMPEYLDRHALCECKVQKLLQEKLLAPLKQMSTVKASAKERLEKVLRGFDAPLLRFTQFMLSINTQPVPQNIRVVETHLGRDLDRRLELKLFSTVAITSHLQSSGYSVVVGSDSSAVKKMLLTLGLFLSARERKMSRLACSWEQEQEGRCWSYEPNLFLQGYLLRGGDAAAPLPFSKKDLWMNRLPVTIVNTDTSDVRVVERNVPIYIRTKELDSQLDTDGKITKMSSEPLTPRDLANFKDAECSSRMVQDFLDNLRLLALKDGVREAYISQFLRLLKLKALALTKYVDAGPRSAMQQVQDFAENALTLRGSPSSDRPRVNQAQLQQDLSLETAGDLNVVLAFAEKVRPSTYLDVLGDPQLQVEALLKEVETL